MHADYASCIDEFADYLDKHAAELENDKCFADFDDYGSSLEQYYRFIYGIMYFESDNIPKEYSEAWGLFRTTVIANKAKLDDLYNLKGVELVTSISDMLTYIEKGNEMANAAMPNDNYHIQTFVLPALCIRLGTIILPNDHLYQSIFAGMLPEPFFLFHPLFKLVCCFVMLHNAPSHIIRYPYHCIIFVLDGLLMQFLVTIPVFLR